MEASSFIPELQFFWILYCFYQWLKVLGKKEYKWLYIYFYRPLKKKILAWGEGSGPLNVKVLQASFDIKV